MTEITANLDQLSDDGRTVAALCFNRAVRQVDEAFGEGYAAKNPHLVAAFMRTAGNAFGAMVIAQQVGTIGSTLGPMSASLEALARVFEDDRIHVTVKVEAE